MTWLAPGPWPQRGRRRHPDAGIRPYCAWITIGGSDRYARLMPFMVIMLAVPAAWQRADQDRGSLAAEDFSMRRSQGVRMLFLVRRMRSTRLLLASMLLIALVTSAFLAALADFAAGRLAAAAQHEVAVSPAASVQVSSTASAAQAGQAGRLITASLRTAFGPAGASISAALWSDPLDLHAPSGAGPTWIAEVAELSGFTAHARLSQGSWAGPPAAGQPVPVTAPASDAALLGLRIGQLVTVADGDTGARLRLTIAGFYTIRDPSARYWRLDLLPVSGLSIQQGFRSYGPFIAAAAAFSTGQIPVGKRSWLAQPASTRLATGELRPTAARISQAGMYLSQSQGLGGIVVSSGMPQLLDSVAASYQVARSLLAICGLELLLVAATTMALAARLLASRRAEETALLLARGLTRRQIAMLALAEAVGFCVVAAAAGVALGPTLAGLLARSLPAGGLLLGTAFWPDSGQAYSSRPWPWSCCSGRPSPAPRALPVSSPPGTGQPRPAS